VYWEEAYSNVHIERASPPRYSFLVLEKAEVWYRDDSPVARLAKLIGERYGVRVRRFTSPRNGTVFGTVEPNRDGDFAGPAVILADVAHQDLKWLSDFWDHPRVRLVGILPDVDDGHPLQQDILTTARCFALLPSGASPDLLCHTVEAAFANLELADREGDSFERAERVREELNQIGVALSSTRDVGSLLEMILVKAREITSADAGSLYLVEASSPDRGPLVVPERCLRFRLTQNDSRQFPYAEHTLPISEESMAGYAALHGKVIAIEDAYSIPANSPFHFNPAYDELTGYRTRSLLTVPMKSAHGEVIGVLQLINCKRNRAAQLHTPADFDSNVRPFPPRAVNLAESLASQAAVAYENSRLYQNIEAMLEGFVTAAVTAIEQRDPTTSGHSTRVATMTLGLAEAVNRTNTGTYGKVGFSSEQMKEIRYAALLHDFGKVAVREEVLVKAKKLYPWQLTILQHRFEYLRKQLEANRDRTKLEIVLARGHEAAREELSCLDEEFRQKSNELEEHLHFILQANEPTLLPDRKFERLIEASRKSYRDSFGREYSLLMPEELDSLLIPQGTLNTDERQQIESHVVHSFNFLVQIPWTRELKHVPWIAGAHHEKLNGSGYPHRLRGAEIPIQAKMMTICDIFDALSAADRPYKNAVSVDRALSILEVCVRDHELDSDLFRIFVEARIFQPSHTTISLASREGF
jgi:HD-GYP domain-containing protein (c-di-GMP phosphodiesterase class II)